MNTNIMTKRTIDASQHKAARVAGFMFLFAFIVPTINWAFVLSKFSVRDQVLDTINNIMADEFLFRVGITVELFLSVGLIILAWTLYRILRPVNKNFALLALLLKLAEATIVSVTVLITFIALQVLNGAANSTALTQDQLQSFVGFLLNSHTAIFSIPMVFLGLNMMVFSYLFYKSKYIPRALAGFGILSFALIFIHALMYILVPEFAMMPINQIIFWAPSGLFEIIIGIWLLSKGIGIQQGDIHSGRG